jgi:CHAT domain-containing protein/Tfp pilus assembly protein PilF
MASIDLRCLLGFVAAASLVLAACADRGSETPAAHEDASGGETLGFASAEGSERSIVTLAREHPDTLRDALARALAGQTSSDADARVVEAATARRLAEAYAQVWADSFFIHEVARFEQWSHDEQRARVAVDSLRREGIAVLGRDGLPAAMTLWQEALRLVASVDSAGRAAVLAALGGGFYLAGEQDSARLYLERARELAGSIGDQRTLGSAIGMLANVSKDQGDFTHAVALYETAAAVRARSGDRRGGAADHNNMGLIARALGDHDQARRSFEQALELNRADDRMRLVALNLTNLGDIASVQGEYERAEGLYDEALAINRADGDLAETAYVLHDLGLLSIRRGDYARARHLLEEAAAIHGQTGALVQAASVRNDLAAVQAAVGDPQAALATLQRATRDGAAAQASGESAAGLALARADVAVQLGAFAEADAAYELAEQHYLRAGDDVGQAEAQHGRALLLYLKGDHDDALRLLERVLRTRRTSGDQRATALTTLLIGQVEAVRGDTGLARQTIEDARQALHGLGDAIGEAAALDALGRLADRGGATLAAEQLYLAGLEAIRGRAAVDVRWQLHTNLAYALRSRGALDAAAEHLRSAMEVLEDVAGGLHTEERRVGYLNDKGEVYAALALTEQQRGRTAQAFTASERLRARQLRDMLARGRVPARRAISEREQDLRRHITELLQVTDAENSATAGQREAAAGASRSESASEALARVQHEYADLLLTLREADPDYRRLITAETVPWSAIAEHLKPDEALLQYLLTDSKTLVFVITSGAIEAIELNLSRAQLANLVTFARRTMERPGSSAATSLWRAPLRRLYQHLIEPVAQRGLLAGKSRLVIIPHGELNFLHFGALLEGGAGDRFLIERFELLYAPSASVWTQLAERSAGRPTGPVLALAPRTESLPASSEEVHTIRRATRGATVLIDQAATKQALRSRVSQHAIVHIASYGILNKHNPLFSFVELAPTRSDDGRLEVHEAYGLELDRQLVVLSACQTALGAGSIADVPAGDDWVGLVQAFLYAGASGVLASLWPVEDRATAQLMRHFYRSLEKGRSEATAIAEAQRAMLRDRNSVHPFYWSGFVLVGGR